MEVPRLGVELELQLLAYTTATATPDLSQVCDLHHNSQQCPILTHYVRPGIKPTSSWMLVGFITSEPQGEVPRVGWVSWSREGILGGKSLSEVLEERKYQGSKETYVAGWRAGFGTAP